MNEKTIVLTGGGTAGHVTPNLAMFPLLKDAGYKIHYIGTANGMEKGLVEKFDYVEYHSIPAGKLRRDFSIKNLAKNISDIYGVISGISKAKKIFKQIRPSVVFSKGGYVSVPVVIAGSRFAPVVAHESDYTPGLANKLSKKYTKVICTTFEETAKQLGNKAIHTGTPIRSELFSGNKQKGLDYMRFSGTKPVLLIMGGSLGAVAINNAVRKSLNELLEVFDIVHICGKGNCDESYIRDGYVQYEYVYDELCDVFAAADIVISRAGANSVFEFFALGKPTLFIPLASASTRGDQILNAEYMEQHGYSMVLAQSEVTKDSLKKAVLSLYENKEIYQAKMKEAESVAVHGTENVLKVIFDAERNGK